MQSVKTDHCRWSRGALGALLASFAVLTSSQGISQGIPGLINYQGRLTDTLGNPVASGYYEIQFRIWDDPVQKGAGSLVWARSFPLHVVTNGLFNVLLSDQGGAVNEPDSPATPSILEAFDGPDRYLGLTITISNSVSVVNRAEISPRQQLASAPFAVHAQTASATLHDAVGADSIKNEAVDTTKLAPSAVTTAKLADGAVTSAKLANNVALTDRSPQTFTGENYFSSSTQTSERLRLSGQEFFKPGVTSTDGVSLLLGVNRPVNRQLWIADSARLAMNSSNPVLRLSVFDHAAVDAIATDGATPVRLSLGPNESVVISPNRNVGIGTTSPSSTLHVNGSMTVENGPVSMFRPLQNMNAGTTYTASTDGFVLVTAYQKHLRWQLWAVSASSPTITQNEYFTVQNADTRTLTIPVAKGERWAVFDTYSGIQDSYLNIYWRGIGQ
ncbi:MAG: hypothetical protein H7A45_09785 [Verrucomicrobiales bacterium]|nr:hypothetical protein [Verrucomicrobiales bacterium]MCP5526299.1 hypothetical protein [Verrucomicrobiales bacterium]